MSQAHLPAVVQCLPRFAVLHQLPDEILHVIMGLLSSNEAVKLGSLHPALRCALGTLPSLEASLDFEATPLRRVSRTRHSTAADDRQQLRGASFGAFTAAHPGIAIALTLQLSLRVYQLQRDYYWSVQFATDWLPLHSVRQLYIKASTYQRGQAQVTAPPLVWELQAAANAGRARLFPERCVAEHTSRGARPATCRTCR